MNRREQILSFWTELSPSINSMFLDPQGNTLNECERREVISYLPNLQGKKVLDLASGIGRFTRYFSSQANEVISVDFVASFLKKISAITPIVKMCSISVQM